MKFSLKYPVFLSLERGQHFKNFVLRWRRERARMAASKLAFNSFIWVIFLDHSGSAQEFSMRNSQFLNWRISPVCNVFLCGKIQIFNFLDVTFLSCVSPLRGKRNTPFVNKRDWHRMFLACEWKGERKSDFFWHLFFLPLPFSTSSFFCPAKWFLERIED